MKNDLHARVYRKLYEAATESGGERRRRASTLAVEMHVPGPQARAALDDLVAAGIARVAGVGEPGTERLYDLNPSAPGAVDVVLAAVAGWLRWQASDGVWRGPVHLADLANLVSDGAPFKPWEPAPPSDRPGSDGAVDVVAAVLRESAPGGWTEEQETRTARTVVDVLDPDVVRLEHVRWCHAAGKVILPPGEHCCAADAPLYAGLRENRSGVPFDSSAAFRMFAAAEDALADMGPHTGTDWGRATTVRDGLAAARMVARELRDVRAALPEREASVAEFADAMREGRPPKHPAARAADAMEALHADAEIPTGRDTGAILARHGLAVEAGRHIDPAEGGHPVTLADLAAIARSLRDVPWLAGRRDHLEGEVTRLCQVADANGIPALRDALADAAAVLACALSPHRDLPMRDVGRALRACEAILGHAAPPLSPPLHPALPAAAQQALARAEGFAAEVLAFLLSEEFYGHACAVEVIAHELHTEITDVETATQDLVPDGGGSDDFDFVAANDSGLRLIRSGSRPNAGSSGWSWELVAAEDDDPWAEASSTLRALHADPARHHEAALLDLVLDRRGTWLSIGDLCENLLGRLASADERNDLVGVLRSLLRLPEGTSNPVSVIADQLGLRADLPSLPRREWMTTWSNVRAGARPAQGGVIDGGPPAHLGEGDGGCVVPRPEWTVAKVRVADLREGDVVRLGPPVAGARAIGWAVALADVAASRDGVEGAFGVATGSDDVTVRYAWTNVRELVDVQRQARISLGGARIEIHSPRPWLA